MTYHHAEQLALHWGKVAEKVLEEMDVKTETMDNNFAIWCRRLGGATISTSVVHENETGEFKPVMTVAELVKRRHRPGIGHSHEYHAMSNGHPNYIKAIRNLSSRANEIEEEQVDYAAHITSHASCDEVAKQELAGAKIPLGMYYNRHVDGSYTISISTTRVPLDTLLKVAKLLN
jgi:hypothetical protein